MEVFPHVLGFRPAEGRRIVGSKNPTVHQNAAGSKGEPSEEGPSNRRHADLALALGAANHETWGPFRRAGGSPVCRPCLKLGGETKEVTESHQNRS